MKLICKTKNIPKSGATVVYNFIILPSLQNSQNTEKDAVGNCEKIEEEVLAPSSGVQPKPARSPTPEFGKSPKFLRKKFDSIKRKLYRQYLPNDMDLYRDVTS